MYNVNTDAFCQPENESNFTPRNFNMRETIWRAFIQEVERKLGLKLRTLTVTLPPKKYISGLYPYTLT